MAAARLLALTLIALACASAESRWVPPSGGGDFDKARADCIAQQTPTPELRAGQDRVAFEQCMRERGWRRKP